jgi:hypothetical protein
LSLPSAHGWTVTWRRARGAGPNSPGSRDSPHCSARCRPARSCNRSWETPGTWRGGQAGGTGGLHTFGDGNYSNTFYLSSSLNPTQVKVTSSRGASATSPLFLYRR